MKTMFVLTVVGLAWQVVGENKPPPPRGEAIVVRVDHPDRQAELLLKLFEGSRVAHPAAGLVAWKRASGGDLGKPLEAAIALFNPLMAPEWRSFDGATLWLDLEGSGPGPRFRALAPRDDAGALAAAAMTARLGSGSDEMALEMGSRRLSVMRLGGESGLLAVVDGPRVALAGNRTSLIDMLVHRADSPPITLLDPARGDGLTAVIDLARMKAPGASSLAVMNRGLAVAKGLHLSRIEARIALHEDRLVAEVEGLVAPGKRKAQPHHGGVDPRWPSGFSHERVMGLVSIAIGPEAEFTDRVFEALDRVQKLDPAYKATAPARVRLYLAARAAGVNLEADLWPRLQGVTAAATARADAPGELTGAILILHANSDASAARIVHEFGPRLGKFVGGLTPDRDPNGGRFRGRASSRPIEVDRRDRDVRLAWGDDAIAALKRQEAAPDPWPTAPLARYGLIWPARCVSTTPAMSPARESLADAPPVVWSGWDQDLRTHDRLVWTGLKERVRILLEHIPLETPPPATGRPHS